MCGGLTYVLDQPVQLALAVVPPICCPDAVQLPSELLEDCGLCQLAVARRLRGSVKRSVEEDAEQICAGTLWIDNADVYTEAGVADPCTAFKALPGQEDVWCAAA